MPYTLIRHLQYSVWANSRIAEVLQKAADDLLYAEVKSSFPTIEKTILHIWDAEFIWMKRLQGENLTDWPSKAFNGGKEELLSGYVRSSKNLLEYIQSKEPGYIYEMAKYKSMKGDAFQNTVEEILFHVVNHGTFHRGQIITILRELGLTDFPPTDLIFFYRV